MKTKIVMIYMFLFYGGNNVNEKLSTVSLYTILTLLSFVKVKTYSPVPKHHTMKVRI
jgi:hypothetical protein